MDDDLRPLAYWELEILNNKRFKKKRSLSEPQKCLMLAGIVLLIMIGASCM